MHLHKFKALTVPEAVCYKQEKVVLCRSGCVLVDIIGSKPSADMEVGGFRKRSRNDADPMVDALALELSFVPKLELPHLNGVLTISPAKKRKVSRPVGSKNK